MRLDRRLTGPASKASRGGPRSRLDRTPLPRPEKLSKLRGYRSPPSSRARPSPSRSCHFSCPRRLERLGHRLQIVAEAATSVVAKHPAHRQNLQFTAAQPGAGCGAALPSEPIVPVVEAVVVMLRGEIASAICIPTRPPDTPSTSLSRCDAPVRTAQRRRRQHAHRRMRE